VSVYKSESSWLVLSAYRTSIAKGSGPIIEWFKMIFTVAAPGLFMWGVKGGPSDSIGGPYRSSAEGARIEAP
jgi:hypothetical protein